MTAPFTELTPAQAQVVGALREEVQTRFRHESTGHDWWHIERVYRTALEIARQEKADLYIVSLAALLHDIADHKFHDGDEQIGPATAAALLRQQEVDEQTIAAVTAIIREVSYKGAGVPTPASSIEGQAVQDADRLDAIGAIGIARAFAYGGSKQRALHDPSSAPQLHSSFEAYKTSQGSTLNHFYEKLLLLKDRMHTESGKRMAAERHAFMVQFVERFLKEWEGK